MPLQEALKHLGYECSLQKSCRELDLVTADSQLGLAIKHDRINFISQVDE